MYPAMLNLEGRKCLVVGGGEVAVRKVQALLAARARVTVVAIKPDRLLEDLDGDSRIQLHVRAYEKGDAKGWALVFAATDSSHVNKQVAQDAEDSGGWVNVADDPGTSTFHVPASIQQGPLVVAMASDGSAPFAIRRLRGVLERRLGPDWSAWIEAAGNFRQAARREIPSLEQRRQAYDLFLASTVDEGSLSVRLPPEREWRSWLLPEAENHKPAGSGRVTLVGAGPGRWDLMTVRGRRRALAADALVFDRLAASALPCDLPPWVELHDVGKTAGHHPVPQEEITALLIRLAREGKSVVRLKGGDPFVFGRGGEEAEALRAAGVPVDVVPGVTAGVAVPAFAGIPVTHRGEAVRVSFITAHESLKQGGSQLRWDLLAQDPSATLVGYMGLSSLPQVVGELLAAGLDPETPSAVIERGTTAAQRSVLSPVAKLSSRAHEAGIRPPALFVIGPTVSRSETLDWLADLPLRAERLVIAAGDGKLACDLDLAGAEVLEVPLPLTDGARVALRAAPVTGCIIRTAAEARSMVKEGALKGAIAWCLSRDAERRAQEVGWSSIRRLGADSPVAKMVMELEGKSSSR